jgi:hypothetical protein
LYLGFYKKNVFSLGGDVLGPKNINEKIAEVEKKIEEVKKRWPAHSVKPALIQELEALEEELEELQGL